LPSSVEELDRAPSFEQLIDKIKKIDKKKQNIDLIGDIKTPLNSKNPIGSSCNYLKHINRPQYYHSLIQIKTVSIFGNCDKDQLLCPYLVEQRLCPPRENR